MMRRGWFTPALGVVALVCASVVGQVSGQLLPAQVLRDLEYARVGARSLRLDLYLPQRTAGARLPVVVWIHGGGWRGGDKARTRAPEVLGEGYVVASIGYRLSHEATFPAQIHDCKAAIRWLRAHADRYGLDPERIGAWGSSAGGHLAALLGTSGDVPELEGTVGEHLDLSSRVQAVCDFFGPADFLAVLEPGAWPSAGRPASAESLLLGGPVAERVDLARLASPVTHVSADDPPFLIVHGDEDRIVPLDQSERLHRALTAAGVEGTLHVVKGGGHGFRDPTVDALVRQFFDRHLRRG
jgi:acetyl esterase/lipase